LGNAGVRFVVYVLFGERAYVAKFSVFGRKRLK
jgi:hypothetical protein